MKKNERGFYLIVAAVSIAIILINIFIVQPCTVTGSSMEPTLASGEIRFINKTDKSYERMDIVVIRQNAKFIIKRIIGLPGETVKIEDSKIIINDDVIDDVVDSFTVPGIARTEILLGENEYFVLGDNREVSLDSRYEEIGLIKKSQIVGKIY